MGQSHKKFYSTTAAARLCQVSRGSVLRWIHEGQLNAALTLGGHHRIQAEDLSALLARQGVPIPEELGLSAGNSPQARKVLIVEDDPDMCRFIRQGLRGLTEPLICDEAHDGLQAGWLLRHQVPDLVLLDIHLPKIDGYAVCRLLKSENIFKNTRIIVSSTYSVEKEALVLELGANYFLKKPFTLEQLKQAVTEQLTSSRVKGNKGVHGSL